MAVISATRTHYLFAANYVVVIAVVAALCSNVCGVPAWYDKRVHPPITPDGRLQYVSEHIMRCKYSTHAFSRAVPWLMVYVFMVMLLQATHTWVCLHRIEALQIARLESDCGRPRGAASRVWWHVTFTVLLLTALCGLLAVVHFDHDYVPKLQTSTGDGAVIWQWHDRSVFHGTGVGALVTGFFWTHMLVLHAYLMLLMSLHDF